MKAGKLKSKFKTKEKKLFWGGDFDPDLYKSHLDSLILFYNDEGYVDARVSRDSIWYADNKRTCTLKSKSMKAGSTMREIFSSTEIKSSKPSAWRAWSCSRRQALSKKQI